MRDFVAGLCTVALIGGTLLLGNRQPAPAGESDETVSIKDETVWIKIVFGTDGEAAVWDGRVQVAGGRAVSLAEWGLESVDQIDSGALAWKIKTGIARPKKGEGWRPSFAEPIRGVLVEVVTSPDTTVNIETEQGDFSVKLADLQPGRPTAVLDGRATVERLGEESLVAQTNTNDDFPAIAIGPDGHRYVAWIAYDHAEKASHLLARDVDDPGSKPLTITASGEFSSVHLLKTASGLRAFWCSSGDRGDWDVYTSTYAAQGWSPAERLTTASGSDFHLDVAQGPSGVWLAWQSFRNGNGDIYAKCLDDGRWSDAIPVTTGPANEWEPSVDVGPDGLAWIGYDTYEHGNYDVYLTSVGIRAGKAVVGERTAIARSENFEAHASVLADRAGRVWVAFDKGGPKWGKDYGNLPDGGPRLRRGEPLHMSRRLGLRCVVDGRLREPSVPLPQKSLLPKGTRFYDYPELAGDNKGRLWLFFRMCHQGHLRGDKGMCWDIFATAYTKDGWLEPIQLPNSEGRLDQGVAVAPGDDGRLHCAWSEGNHFINREDRKYSVHYGALAELTEPAGTLPLRPIEAEPAGKPEPVPKPPWTIKRRGEEYRLYFGDLHRHSHISICLPRIDGSLTDNHRYALAAAALDFLAITDHTHDLNPYAWWRSQQQTDWFHIPGRYVTIYGYERSNFAEGGGHRNVFFLDRGWEVNGSDYYHRYTSYLGLPKPNTDPDESLYPWLKKGKRGDAFTIAHTPEYSRGKKRGTWDFNDPEVEPVVEIFQAFRRSYERPDGGVSQESSVWDALSKGHLLGFIASSDHRSTHLSYACVWATENSRRALFDAILARRTFAATDRIALELRIGDTLMGEQTHLNSGNPTLQIRAAGTAPIDEIQIIRSNRVIATLRPNTRDVDLKHIDPDPLPGPSYYYVRLHQTDGNVAWGSPIWVER